MGGASNVSGQSCAATLAQCLNTHDEYGRCPGRDMQSGMAKTLFPTTCGGQRANAHWATLPWPEPILILYPFWRPKTAYSAKLG